MNDTEPLSGRGQFELELGLPRWASATHADKPPPKTRRGELVGLLASGGLDSCILLRHLLDVGRRVKPFYVLSGLCWQDAEFAALERYLAAAPQQLLEPLTVLELPLADAYGDHWSITGQGVPAADTPDEAVFLPGRNVFLIAKAALWCQIHGIGVLTLATLRSNPFEDASDSFFDNWQTVLNGMWPRSIRLARPFEKLDKRQVMEIGRDYPLELTFSCIAPGIDQVHCGQCNKCAERQAAFRLGGFEDPTTYDRSTCCVTSSNVGSESHQDFRLGRCRRNSWRVSLPQSSFLQEESS